MKPNTVGRAGGTVPQQHPIVMSASEAGLLSGTVLLTKCGETPVEHISEGDKIITRDRGFVAVNRVIKSRQMVRAISFVAGSLGDTRPDTDLVLPAGQQVLIRDWRAQALFGHAQACVRADMLVDGEFIRDLGLQMMELYQLQFEADHILYAGGLEVAAHPLRAEIRPAA